MSAPAPIDPKADAEQRRRASASLRHYHASIAVFGLQGLLSFVAGAWAGRVADDGSGTLALYAGVASVFAFAGATGASYVFRLAGGTVLAVLGLPALIRKVTASPPPPPGPPDPREQRAEFVLHLLTTGVHASVLLALFLVVAAGVSFAAEAGFPTLAWRFALAGALVSVLTWRALKLPW